MKIVHLSTEDSHWGAMIAAHRLNSAMNRSKLSSRMLVAQKDSDDSSVSGISLSPAKRQIHKWLMYAEGVFSSRILKTSYTYSWDKSDISLICSELLDADIIYIHWTEKSFLNSRAINNILQFEKPTYFFLHDMYHFTGGCHYSLECEKYRFDCSRCPIIIRRILSFYSSRILRRKERALYNHNNFGIITPSQWLAKCAKDSSLFRDRDIYMIPNLLNTAVFKILERTEARKTINIPLSKKLILFGAVDGSSSPYKGWTYLVEALKKLKTRNAGIVIFGENISKDDLSNFTQEVLQVGFLSDQHSLMLLYNACDVFVIPSIAENYPQTVMESISCGTPVVGFDVGGIPDLVQTGKTGYLAKYKDTDDLAKGIDSILQEDIHITRESLHSFAEVTFSESVVLEKHKALWNQTNIVSHE